MANSDLVFRASVNRFDAAHVRQIVSSSGFFSEDEISIAVELVEERLEQGMASGYHFVFVEANNRTVGYGCFGPIPATKNSYDLYWIAVDDEYRGQGIGKRLLAECEQEIKKLGGHRIYIETSSRALYKPTRAFYVASGYREEAVLTDFYALGDSKHIYVKVI